MLHGTVDAVKDCIYSSDHYMKFCLPPVSALALSSLGMPLILSLHDVN